MNELQELIMPDVSRSRNNSSRWNIVSRSITVENFFRKRAQITLCTNYGESKGMSPIERFFKIIMDDIIRIVFRIAQFLNDNSFFFFKFLFGKKWIESKISENIGRKARVFIQRPRIITSVLLAGECIQVSAYRLDTSRDCLRGTFLRSFEHHMLDKMRNPVCQGVFVP